VPLLAVQAAAAAAQLVQLNLQEQQKIALIVAAVWL
jgi:hypothetical protein